MKNDLHLINVVNDKQTRLNDKEKLDIGQYLPVNADYIVIVTLFA